MGNPYQARDDERTAPLHCLFSTIYSNSDSEWVRLEHGSTETSLGVSVGFQDILAGANRGGWGFAYVGVTGASQTFLVTQATQPLTAPVLQDVYDPAFVTDILAADAAPAEEGFDNVVDLLDWLNRD
jgi:hypothetical protein